MTPRLPFCRPVIALRRVFLGVACLVAALGGFAAEDEARFSSTLTAAQRSQAGFAQLTDDNIAVIDALVRQDEAALRRQNGTLRPGNFSQRRTEHERDAAGLARLTPEQRVRLDDLVAQRTAPIPQLTAEVGTSPRVPRRNDDVTPPFALEVHGSVSLTYAWSKGGGNVRGGDMVVSIQDPAHRMAVTVGYSEYRGKGLTPYYDPYDDLSRYRPVPNLPVIDR